jgi:hypothetical protein
MQQSSHLHQQCGNALPEKMVDTICRGIRVAPHADTNLPPNFWGYAAAQLNFVDVYNHLPHSSLDHKTPWECTKNSKPDVSWFRPFGSLTHCPHRQPQGMPTTQEALSTWRAIHLSWAWLLLWLQEMNPEIEADTSAHLPPNGRNRHNEADQFLDPQDI